MSLNGWADNRGSSTETKNKYSEKLIFEQLARVCSSNEFKLKYRLCDLLKYLVQETLSGRENKLKNYTIGRDIFKREEDFNPELDPIVRIQVGRLRNSLNRYYMGEGKNDAMRIHISVGNYVPSFIEQAETENESPEKIETIDKDKSLAPSILVLPFENLTGEKDQEYFVQGFSEELSIILSGYRYLTMVGYRGGYNPNTDDINAILKKLNPRFLVTGSVREKTGEVKISVKLIDTITNEHLWSEQFKRKLSSENMIAIQEDIARETVLIIGNEFGIIPQRIKYDFKKKKPSELETYEAILQYYYYHAHRTAENEAAAFSALEHAIVKEPDNGTTCAMLATLYGDRILLGFSSDENNIVKMRELSTKAVELEPDNQLARIISAWSYFVQDEKERFLVEMEKALALKPRSPFRIGACGFYLCLYGEWERGKALLDKAMTHSIGYPPWYYGATTVYHYRLNEYDKAYEEALKYDIAGLFWGPLLRTAVLGKLGRKSDAEKEISILQNFVPEFETKAHYLISRFVKEEQLAEHIIEGLNQAGMKIKHKHTHSI